MTGAIVWLLTQMGRLRVTMAYATALVVMAVMLRSLGPGGRQEAIQHASTNLHNLADGSFTTLIDSAFITQSEYLYVWLPGLVALLALAELLWRGRRLVLAFAVGHIGTTLIVAVGLAAALLAGLVEGPVADAADVGMSYGAVAVLGTLTLAVPRRWSPAWAGGWLALAAGSVLASGGDFTTIGHAVALMIGMTIGTRFGEPSPWTATRCGLLVVATAFGYLMICFGYVSLGASAAIGAIGAVLGTALSLALRPAQTNSSALASIQSDSHASGGHSSNSPGISHS